MTREPSGAPGTRKAPAEPRREFHIFINYRREETSAYAGRLYDELAGRFGDENVFMDIDAIRPGEDFAEVVEAKVGSCDVLLALIGKNWVQAKDEEGRVRLGKPHDWVRMEILAALDRADTRVIPTLVQGAEMPNPDELPEPLRKLSVRNAVELSDRRWHSDVQNLIAYLEELAGPVAQILTSDPETPGGRESARRWPRWLVAVLAGAVLIAGVALAIALFTGGGSGTSGATSETTGGGTGTNDGTTGTDVFRPCGDGKVSANQHTTCIFARAVHDKVVGNGSALGTYKVHSPATGSDYTMKCGFDNGKIVCRGGNDAAVSWSG